jgi:hypothetical protein
MNRNAGLLHGLSSAPIIYRAVPEAGAPVHQHSPPTTCQLRAM